MNNNKQAETLAKLIADTIFGEDKGKQHTDAMLEFNNNFFDIVKLDAGKIATLQQEEANTTLYCEDPHCVPCQIHLKPLIAKNREITLLVETVLRPHKKLFAKLYTEMAALRKAGEDYVREV